MLRYPSAFVISATPVRRILPHVPAALAIAVVLAAYAWFGGGASFSFPRIGWEDSYYASLAEGFFRGHLYMAYQPDPRLMALPFPYDYKAREGKVDWNHAETAQLEVRELSERFVGNYLDAEWPEVGYTVGVFRLEARGVQLFSSIRGDHFTILGMPLIPLLGALRERSLLLA